VVEQAVNQQVIQNREPVLDTLGPIWRMPDSTALDFVLPNELEASAPPEARGLTRDQVRLMVSYVNDSRIIHASFRDIIEYLVEGDVIVINTSKTMKASLTAQSENGHQVELHISTHLEGDRWSAEIRQPGRDGSSTLYDLKAGEMFFMDEGASAQLLAPYSNDRRGPQAESRRNRLWVTRLKLPRPAEEYMDRYGSPIRYKYVAQEWPLVYYQNVFASEFGSAEMPSAGRAFTHEIIAKLALKGVSFVPLVLHTGVASLEEHEVPYEEYYRVPAWSAKRINQAREEGRHVIATGTTTLRALETVVDCDGLVHSGQGWTSLVITPDRHIRSVDGLLTGFHEPRSSHLSILSAMAGLEHVRATYAEALKQGYLWHEFGDLHLILKS
jgi:S-adenosylmethionine:tRNA ribosyltransferase-isomerase